MSNEQEHYDRDADYQYSAAEKVGKRPTEADEIQFCARVFEYVTKVGLSETEARRKAFAELIA